MRIIALPAAVGLMVMPAEIISVVYERGAFDARATQATALALAAFASGLPAYVMLKVFQPAFFAREDMRTPFYFSVIMVVVNIALSLSLFPTYGHVAIAIATSVSAWVNLLLLAVTSWRREDFRPDGATLKRLVLLLISSLLMGAAIWLMQGWLQPWLDAGFLVKFLAVGAMISIGATLYFAFALLTGAMDRTYVKRLLRR